MANGGGSNTTMAFIVGGLVVAVAILAYFIFGEGPPDTVEGGDSTTVTVETSEGDAGAAVSGGDGSGGGDSGEEGTSGGGESGAQSGN